MEFQKALVLAVLSFLIINLVGFLFLHFGDGGRIAVQNNQTDESFAAEEVEDSHTVQFADGTTATFGLSDAFTATVAAEDLGKARFMTESPDGRIFVPDMVDYNLSHEGRLMILDDFNEETKRFETHTTYLEDLRGPNNVAFYTDENNQTWLYLTLTEHLLRYPYEAGDTAPAGEPEVVYTFPNTQSERADGVVWHITRTVLFDDETMYVSVGSGCNLCEEDVNEDRAVILAMDPDGTNVRTYAEGIKNAVGLDVVDGTLYATENGADHLGSDAPDDTMFAVEEGAHYGWPYCYELDGEKYADSSQEWAREPIDCSVVPGAFVAFAPHAAPLGFAYFEDATVHETLADHFLVALQGSWETEIGTGYQLVRVRRDGTSDVFMDGFITESGERVGRPVDVLEYRNGFLVTDDFNGRMYYVFPDNT